MVSNYSRSSRITTSSIAADTKAATLPRKGLLQIHIQLAFKLTSVSKKFEVDPIVYYYCVYYEFFMRQTLDDCKIEK